MQFVGADVLEPSAMELIHNSTQAIIWSVFGDLMRVRWTKSTARPSESPGARPKPSSVQGLELEMSTCYRWRSS